VGSSYEKDLFKRNPGQLAHHVREVVGWLGDEQTPARRHRKAVPSTLELQAEGTAPSLGFSSPSRH
jgi:hypothetical protein